MIEAQTWLILVIRTKADLEGVPNLVASKGCRVLDCQELSEPIDLTAIPFGRFCLMNVLTGKGHANLGDGQDVTMRSIDCVIVPSRDEDIQRPGSPGNKLIRQCREAGARMLAAIPSK